MLRHMTDATGMELAGYMAAWFLIVVVSVLAGEWIIERILAPVRRAAEEKRR